MSDNQFNFGPTVISNSLNDSSTTKALSAAKGKELSESIIKPITIDLDTVTNTSGSYTHTTTIATTGLITEGMKCIGLEVGNPAAFGDMPTITAGNDEITLSCSSVSGTSTIKVTMMRTTQATSSGIMPTAVTSEEFDILADRIGDIDDLTTTAKTDVVAAVNENNTLIGNLSNRFGYAMPVSYDGKTPSWISGGEYILVLGGSLTPGLYIANQGMSAGTTLTSSNVTISVYGNLANDLNHRYETVNTKITKLNNDINITSQGVTAWTAVTVTVINGTYSSIDSGSMACRYDDNYVCVKGIVRVRGFTRTGSNPGIQIALPVDVNPKSSVLYATGNFISNLNPSEYLTMTVNSHDKNLRITTSENLANASNGVWVITIPHLLLERYIA